MIEIPNSFVFTTRDVTFVIDNILKRFNCFTDMSL